MGIKPECWKNFFLYFTVYHCYSSFKKVSIFKCATGSLDSMAVFVNVNSS